MTSSNAESDLQSAKGGDLAALDRLLTSVQDRLSERLSRRLGQELRAQARTSDLLQNTYLDVLRGIRGFSGADVNEFVGWVAQVMENNLRDQAKYVRAEKRRRPDALPEGDAISPRDLVGSVSQGAMMRDDLSLVSRAIAKLLVEHRDVILWKAVEGLDHDQIAARIGKTPAAARMLLSRARAALTLAIESERHPPA